VNADIQIQAIGLPQRDLPITMYDRFDSLGAALGLPPHGTRSVVEGFFTRKSKPPDVADQPADCSQGLTIPFGGSSKSTLRGGKLRKLSVSSNRATTWKMFA
jgi:hypothetical protein